jgi:hypothetical protein
MKNRGWLVAWTLVGATAWGGIGCVAHAQATGFADTEAPVVFTEPPTLVEVDGESFWVVRDCDQSVYYVDGYYWVYRGEKWHRARSYDAGWTVVEVTVVPAVIVHRDHYRYVHYHGAATAKTRTAPRENLANADDHGDKHESDKDKGAGPPDHAGGPHDGPPGHDEIPGVGNQRKAENGNAANVGKEPERKDDKKKDGKRKKDDKKK